MCTCMCVVSNTPTILVIRFDSKAALARNLGFIWAEFFFGGGGGGGEEELQFHEFKLTFWNFFGGRGEHFP